MVNVKLNLPEGLEKDLKHLETISKKPRDFHIKKALIRYLEDMEDIRDIEGYIERKRQGKVKYYTSEEANKRLKELRVKNA